MEQNFEHKSLGFSWNPLGVLHILCKCGRAFLISLLCASQHMGRGRHREVPFIQKTRQELGHRIPHSRSINSQHLQNSQNYSKFVWSVSTFCPQEGNSDRKSRFGCPSLTHAVLWVGATALNPWTRPDGKLILNRYQENSQSQSADSSRALHGRTHSTLNTS